MEPDSMWQLITFFVLVSFSALFSAAETAFRSVTSTRLNQAFEDGDLKLKRGTLLMRSPERLRGVLLVGDNVFNIGAVILATYYYIENSSLHPLILLISLVVMIIILGEIIPKAFGSLYPLVVIRSLSPLVSLLSLPLFPLIKLMLWITDLFVLAIGGNPDNSKPFITEEELMSYVNASHEDGILEVEEKKMIYNVVEFGDIDVTQVMTPRTDIISAPLDGDYQMLYDLFKSEEFTRIPIYEDDNDHIVGILNIKKWMFFDGKPEDYQIKDHMRQPFFTYESKKTSELLNEMRLSKHQMAIVLDEYGGTSGIVTIEDLIEEIVGEIDDEFDDEYTEIKLIDHNRFQIEGSTNITDVNERLGLSLASDDFDSIGGFIMGLLGRLPAAGDEITFENITFKVLEVEKNRIEMVELTMELFAGDEPNEE